MPSQRDLKAYAKTYHHLEVVANKEVEAVVGVEVITRTDIGQNHLTEGHVDTTDLHQNPLPDKIKKNRLFAIGARALIT